MKIDSNLEVSFVTLQPLNYNTFTQILPLSTSFSIITHTLVI